MPHAIFVEPGTSCMIEGALFPDCQQLESQLKSPSPHAVQQTYANTAAATMPIKAARARTKPQVELPRVQGGLRGLGFRAFRVWGFKV